MERDDVMERMRAARPPAAAVDGDAFDGALLARVRAQPEEAAGRRRVAVSRAVALPVAAGVAFAAAGVIMFGGGPDDVGGPSSAQAITSQTLHWLDPPAGTILHASSVETQGGVTTTRTIWQSADDPAHQRIVVSGVENYEQAGDVLYDPSTDTIYDAAVAAGPIRDHRGDQGPKDGDVAAKKQRQAEAANRSDAGSAKGSETQPAQPGRVKPGGGETLPAGDPIVIKVRMLLQDGRMTVAGRELHDGVMAWKVALKEGQGRPTWTFWVSADDGKPLELVDPGRDGDSGTQVVRWSAYEVLPKTDATATAALSLTGAHPSAQVDHDPAAAEAAWNRVLGKKG